MPAARLKTAIPVLASDNVASSVDYFVRVLGFEQQWIWGDPPVYAGLRSGDALIYVSHDPDLASAIQNMHLAPDVFFWVDDIESLHARHAASGAEIVERLETKPWGTRQYTVRQPNGYLLKFASDAR
jgi:uncharacterized glyoxalase superfamily protein PhnB